MSWFYLLPQESLINIIIIIISLLVIFPHQLYLGAFHWSLSNSKSPHSSLTDIDVLSNLNNAVVYMILILPLSYYKSLLPILLGSNITFMFHIFLSTIARFKYLPVVTVFFYFKPPAHWCMGRVFANGPADHDSFSGRFIPKTYKWYLIALCLTLTIIRYISRVKWSNPGERVVPYPALRCSSYWKWSLRVILDYGRQLYLLDFKTVIRSNGKSHRLKNSNNCSSTCSCSSDSSFHCFFLYICVFF